MRVTNEHRLFAERKLKDESTPAAPTKRGIIEELQDTGVMKAANMKPLTRSQANSCVRNVAKRLGVYNKLTVREKEVKRENILNQDIGHCARVAAIVDNMGSGKSEKRHRPRPKKNRRDREDDDGNRSRKPKKKDK